MDETGWRLKGVRRTLWGAFTEKLAVYRIACDRHEDRVRELLAASRAIVTSDRWWAYNHLPLGRRQICWSHLRRDFTAHAETGGAEHELGEHGLRICDQVFWAWEIYQHTGYRKELKRRVRRLRRELKPILRQASGKKPRYKRTRGPARNLLKVWPALWTFAERPGIHPTNNHAERALKAQSSTENSRSAANQKPASDESNGSSQPPPPAACNAAPSSNTSANCSLLTPAATPLPRSSNPPAPRN